MKRAAHGPDEQGPASSLRIAGAGVTFAGGGSANPPFVVWTFDEEAVSVSIRPWFARKIIVRNRAGIEADPSLPVWTRSWPDIQLIQYDRKNIYFRPRTGGGAKMIAGKDLVPAVLEALSHMALPTQWVERIPWIV